MCCKLVGREGTPMTPAPPPASASLLSCTPARLTQIHRHTPSYKFLWLIWLWVQIPEEWRHPPGHESTSAIFAGLPSASRECCCSSHMEGQRLEKEDKRLLPHTCINTTILKKSYCASTLLFEGLFRNLGFSWFLILIQEPVGSKGDGRVCAQVSLKGIFAYLLTPSTSPPGNSHIEYSEYMSIHIYLVREDIK